jgi:hypothetical protein
MMLPNVIIPPRGNDSALRASQYDVTFEGLVIYRLVSLDPYQSRSILLGLRFLSVRLRSGKVHCLPGVFNGTVFHDE